MKWLKSFLFILIIFSGVFTPTYAQEQSIERKKPVSRAFKAASKDTTPLLTVRADDKSLYYLGQIFANVPGLPITGDNFLFSSLVCIFNQVIFGLGLVIFVFTLVVGTIKTAQEGEVLGKSWSSILIPARAALGAYLLIPQEPSCYNMIQIIVLWLVVKGVWAANSLWEQVLDYNLRGQLINEVTEAGAQGEELEDAMKVISGIFLNSLCIEMLNNSTQAQENLDFVRLSAYVNVLGDSINFGDPNLENLGAPICGSVAIPTIGKLTANADDPEVKASRQIVAQAILAAQQLVGGPGSPVQEIIANPAGPWSESSKFLQAASLLQNAQNTLMAQNPKNITAGYNIAVRDGWIHAGSYYFNLVTRTSLTSNRLFLDSIPPADKNFKETFGNTFGTELFSALKNNFALYLQDAGRRLASLANNAAPSPEGLTLNPPDFGAFSNVFDAFFSDFFYKILKSITGIITDNQGLNKDPLVAMAKFGSDLTLFTEAIFWAAVGTVFGLWLITAIMHCVSPAGPSANAALSFIMPIAMVLLFLVWGAGIMLGLYVPFIPFLVFTLSAVTWILLVVEATLGAPLIALTLIVPSEDEIGKAGHAMVILLGLVLRPALMILGFILASRVLGVFFNLLNYAFIPTLKGSIGYVGVFSIVAIIVLYTGIAVSLVHEAFSLIYVLPDKVLRWMGGHPEGGDIGNQVRELEGSTQKGAKATQTILQANK